MKKMRHFAVCFLAAHFFMTGCDVVKKYQGKKDKKEEAAYSETSEFSISLGDESDVKLAKEFLRPTAILGKNLSSDDVHSNLVLPDLGLQGVAITWASDNTTLVAKDGKVTRPELGESDTVVHLTATFKKGEVIDRKLFVVTVRAYQIDELRFEYVSQDSSEAGSLPSSSINTTVFSGTTMYVGTSNGLAISSDSGATWTTKGRNDGLMSDTIDMLAANGTVVVAGQRQSNHVAVSTDSGKSWRPILYNGIYGYIYGVAVTDTKIFIITSTEVYASADNGVTWTTLTTSGVSSLSCIYASGTNIYVGGYDGLAISADSGVTWAKKTTANGLGSNTIYAMANTGTILYAGTSAGLSLSIDNGANFTTKTTANGLHQNYVYQIGAAGTNVMVTGYDGYLNLSTDSGATFTNYTANSKSLSYYPNGITVTASAYYVAGSSGLGISANGSTYTVKSLSSDFATKINGLSIDSSNLYVAATKAYKVPLSTLVPAELTTVASAYSVASSSAVTYFGGASALYKSIDGGTTVTAVAGYTGAGGTIYDLKFSGNNLYLATANGFYSSADAGTTFTAKTTANGLATNSNQHIAVSGTSIMLANSLLGAGASISIDGGSTFTAKTASSGLPSLYVYGVTVLGSKFIAATSSGVAEFATSSATATASSVYSDERGLQSSTVNSVFGAKASLWVCTTSGLSVSLNGGSTFYNFDTRHGLPAAGCEEIIVSGKHVFVSTTRGLAHASW